MVQKYQMGFICGYLILATSLCCSQQAIILKDFSKCEPNSAVSAVYAIGKWQLLDVNGNKVLWADGKSTLPSVTLPINRSGWHDIYVATVTEPEYFDDAEWKGIHVKLTSDKWFTQLSGGRTGLGKDQPACIDEFFWKRADITGQDITVFAPHGRFFKSAGGVAYIKLVPVSMEQVEADKKTSEQKLKAMTKPSLGGMADYWSWVFVTKGITPDFTQRTINQHHAAGFDTIYFQINADGTVHYPSKVAQHYYWDSNEEPRGEGRVVADIIKNHDTLKVACEQAKKNGMRFFVWFRATNEQHPDSNANEYSRTFRNMHIRGCDNNPTRWPSLVHPEVQEYKLRILKELVTDYNVDGVMVDFLRTMPVIGYDEPVVAAYVKRYKVNPITVASERSSMRWKRFRASYVTKMMKSLRDIVDQENKKSGRNIQIAARICARDNLWKGLDVETWIKLGLVDIVIPSNYTWFDPFVSSKEIQEMAKGTKCKVYGCVSPFFAGGTDDAENDLARNEKEVEEIIYKRCAEGASNLEWAQRIRDIYADGASGVVVYESETLASDPPICGPGRVGYPELFKNCGDPMKLVNYINTIEVK